MTPAEVTAFTPLVKACARRFTPSSLPASIDADDLEQVAWQALLEAEQTFDGSSGAPFAAWAWLKMRGAVLDEVRRRRAGTRRYPSDEPCCLGEGDASRASTPDAVEAAMSLRELVAAVQDLPPRERSALLGRLNGRKGCDVADELGVTESRVSQLNSAAIGRLRRQVAA